MTRVAVILVCCLAVKLAIGHGMGDSDELKTKQIKEAPKSSLVLGTNLNDVTRNDVTKDKGIPRNSLNEVNVNMRTDGNPTSRKRRASGRNVILNNKDDITVNGQISGIVQDKTFDGLMPTFNFGQNSDVNQRVVAADSQVVTSKSQSVTSNSVPSSTPPESASLNVPTEENTVQATVAQHFSNSNTVETATVAMVSTSENATTTPSVETSSTTTLSSTGTTSKVTTIAAVMQQRYSRACPPAVRIGSRLLCLVQLRYRCNTDADCVSSRKCCPGTCGNICRRVSHRRSRLLTVML